MVNYPTSLDTDATLWLVSNQAQTTLNGDLGTSGGNNNQSASIDVVDGTNFGASGGFVLIESELIQYTSKVANKLIGITRAYGGTTALAHYTGAQVKTVVMAEHHNALKDAIIAIETKLGITGSDNYARRTSSASAPASPNPGDIWDSTSDGQLKMFSGGVWKVIGG